MGRGLYQRNLWMTACLCCIKQQNSHKLQPFWDTFAFIYCNISLLTWKWQLFFRWPTMLKQTNRFPPEMYRNSDPHHKESLCRCSNMPWPPDKFVSVDKGGQIFPWQRQRNFLRSCNWIPHVTHPVAVYHKIPCTDSTLKWLTIIVLLQQWPPCRRGKRKTQMKPWGGGKPDGKGIFPMFCRLVFGCLYLSDKVVRQFTADLRD